MAWVVTYRDAEAERAPARDALTRLSRRASVLALRRLSREDSAQLVKQSIPSADPEIFEALFRATSGNPLFLSETLRALLRE